MEILLFADVEDGAIYPFAEVRRYVSSANIRTVRSSEYFGNSPASLICGLLQDGSPSLKPIDLIVGTGFGALFALAAGQVLHCKTVLINPLYPLDHYGQKYAPEYEYADELHSMTFGKVCGARSCLNFANTYVILGLDDDIADVRDLPGYFRGDNHCVYVPGGHYPHGEEFSRIFGEVSGLSGAARNCRSFPDANDVEDGALASLMTMFDTDAWHARSVSLSCFQEERHVLHASIDKLADYIRQSKGAASVLVLSADELPVEAEQARQTVRGIDLLIIENIASCTMSKEVDLSFWAMCDQVQASGGSILLVTDFWACDIFENMPNALRILQSFDFYEYELSDYNDEKSTRIERDLNTPCHLNDLYELKDFHIDDVDMSFGHINVFWSKKGEELKTNRLSLYYDAGWKWEMFFGYRQSDKYATDVLRAAAEAIIEQAEHVEYRLK